MRIDLSNALKERVGDEGLSPDEVEELRDRIEKVHDKIEARRSGTGLGFMELPFAVDFEDIEEFADELREDFDNFVNIGIGGSALGGATLTNSLQPDSNVYFPDNIDPDSFARLLDSIDLSQTVFNVVSKSGTTAETISNFLIAREKLENSGHDWDEHFVVTTGESGPLRHLAERHDLPLFEIPEGVPGRYSVLSPVGLLSASFAGASPGKVLEGAREVEDACTSSSLDENPAYAIAGFSYFLDEKHGKNVSVMMPYAERLELFADWYAQLWAESLGKKNDREGNLIHSGQTPLTSVGATDQHSLLQLFVEGPNDKLVTFVGVEDRKNGFEVPETEIDEYSYLEGVSLSRLIDTELDATRASLTEEGRPNFLVELESINEHEIGQLLYTYEVATAAAGELYGVNAFNQPGVESSKNATYASLGREGYDDEGEMEEIQETVFGIEI